MQTYILQGSHKAISQKKFQTKQGDYLIIAERKNSNPYLLLNPKDTKDRIYISSLYDNFNGTFNLDYRGIKYLATISEDSFSINIR